MVIAYDQEARSMQLFIDEAQEKEKAERKKVAEKMASLKAERDAANQSSKDVFVHLQSTTLEKKKAEERLAEMEKAMMKLKASHEEELERAVATARRTSVAEVRDQLNNARGLFAKLKKKPMRHMVFYSQTEANLQLLDEIENATNSDPFDFVAERIDLAKNKAKYGPGNEAFDNIARELEKVLGKNYELSINCEDIVFSPWLEEVAKSVGVSAASGSNDGSFGLRLKEAGEEPSSESDESESDRDKEAGARDEVVPDVTRAEQAPTDPVVEKQTGEAASSTVPAAQIEEAEKEAGEL